MGIYSEGRPSHFEKLHKLPRVFTTRAASLVGILRSLSATTGPDI